LGALIIGLGQVGDRIKAVCSAMGMTVYSIRKNTISQLNSFLPKADYVFNLLPLTPETEKIIGYWQFRKMKDSAFFINVGRGETVDQTALLQALREGQISGAGLDVFEKEPLSENSALRKIPSAIVMPHVAGVSQLYWRKEYSLFRKNLKRYLKKQPLINRVYLNKKY
jgi:D-2-hydroxyacid dehydrogenase (NADP+)